MKKYWEESNYFLLHNDVNKIEKCSIEFAQL